LKAILWMREEVYGLEESFKLALHITNAFAKAEVNNKDTSVELYLLNHWVRDFSLRDIIDRVSLSSTSNEHYFPSLLTWLL